MKREPLDYRSPTTGVGPPPAPPSVIVFWVLFCLLGLLLSGLAIANDYSLKPYQLAAYFICGVWVLAAVLWARKRAALAYQAASAFAILFWVFAAIQVTRWGIEYGRSPFWTALAIVYALPVLIALSVMAFIVLRWRLWRWPPERD